MARTQGRSRLKVALGSPSEPPSTETCQILQDRLALFGKVGVIFTLVFDVFMYGYLRHEGQGLVASLTSRGSLYNWGVTAIALALWSLRGVRPLKTGTLRSLDLMATALICGFCGLSSWFQDGRPLVQFGGLLGAMNVLIMRAVLIPSAAPTTLFISVLSLLPVVVPAFFQETPGAAAGAPAAHDEALHRQQGMFACWGAISVVSAVAVSHVIYGLQCKVRQAQQLGQYKLEEKIGEGAMGEVYKAYHAMLRRPTAIKLLRPERAGRESIARFEREVQLTSRLTHPNTIAIYDYGHTDEGTFYYAMEYLPGYNLDALVRESGPQPAARVIHILKQVCGSLAEAHGAGLIHRDIKSANIILCERGGILDVVKVVDFGLVKNLAQEGDASLTAANTITGTPFYLSPEAIRSPGEVDARTDLYAVGVVGYYLLTGKHPFDGGSFVEICGHHLHTTPERPSARLGRPLPEDLEAVILTCMEKDPARRPGSAQDLVRTLAACRDDEGWSPDDSRRWWEENGNGRLNPASPADLAAAATLDTPSPRVAVRLEGRLA